jgi:hypothetical protein
MVAGAFINPNGMTLCSDHGSKVVAFFDSDLVIGIPEL